MKAHRAALAALAIVVPAAPAAAETAPEAVRFDGGAIADSLSGIPGNPEEGRKIMSSRALGNCVACHQVSALSDVAWQGEVGPVLDGAGSRWSEAELRGIVADAKKTFDDSVMPSFYKVAGFIRPGDAYTGKPATEIRPLLSAQQIEDVVAFLATLRE